jgi:hypothetical protein
MAHERPAEFNDTVGDVGHFLFACHKRTGRRITVRKFYGLRGLHQFERGGYVLMTTAPKKAPSQTALFD